MGTVSQNADGSWSETSNGKTVSVNSQHIKDHHPDIYYGQQSAQLLAAAEASKIDYNELLKYQTKAISQIAKANAAVLPDLSSLSTKLGSSFASSINPQIASEFYSYLSNVNPEWRSNFIGEQQNALTQVAGYANQLMTGELDQETIDNTLRTMAEAGYSRGQFGGLASSNVARNLGLTSMQLKQQGAQLFTDAVSPLSGRLLSTTMALMPQTVNAGAAASQMLGFLAGGLGSGQIGQQSITQSFGTNADIAWSSRMSAFNAEQDNMAWAYNVKQQQQAEKYQRIGTVAGYLNGIGRIS